MATPIFLLFAGNWRFLTRDDSCKAVFEMGFARDEWLEVSKLDDAV